MTALVVLAALVGGGAAGVAAGAAFVVQQARELHGSRREMDRQLADLLKERP